MRSLTSKVCFESKSSCMVDFFQEKTLKKTLWPVCAQINIWTLTIIPIIDGNKRFHQDWNPYIFFSRNSVTIFMFFCADVTFSVLISETF